MWDQSITEGGDTRNESLHEDFNTTERSSSLNLDHPLENNYNNQKLK
jgi:hypothetical protein